MRLASVLGLRECFTRPDQEYKRRELLQVQEAILVRIGLVEKHRQCNDHALACTLAADGQGLVDANPTRLVCIPALETVRQLLGVRRCGWPREGGQRTAQAVAKRLVILVVAPLAGVE